MEKNAFELADRRFSNADLAGIHVTHLGNDDVRLCLDTVKQAFRSLDYSDDYQAQLRFRLFKLRCSILFGLAPYSHAGLRLKDQGEELVALAQSLPRAREPINRVKVQLDKLVGTANPKLEWILQQDWKGGKAVVFTPMAMGKSSGSHLIEEQRIHHLSVIHSISELRSGKYSTLVLPGTVQYLSHALAMRLLHQGEFRTIHVLLHEGEPLSLKKRLKLPSSPLFPALPSKGDLKIECSKIENQVCDDFLWSDNVADHSEKNAQAIGLAARCLLFENGTELHAIENEYQHVWRPNGPDKLMRLYPGQLMEGDCLIREKGPRHDLLFREGENTSFRYELDTTDIWRVPLNAMLLNHTPRKVATLLLKTGYLHSGTLPESEDAAANSALRNLHVNVANWADGRVFGPRDVSHMRALVRVLVENGYLKVDGPPDDTADGWFAALEGIRSDRRSAGVSLSSQRDELLQEYFREHGEPKDAQELVLGNGMVVSIHKLAMVGDVVQVAPDAVIKDPVRGALRWLE